MQLNPTYYPPPSHQQFIFLHFPSVYHRQEVGTLAERRPADGINVHYLTVYRTKGGRGGGGPRRWRCELQNKAGVLAS